jgi:glycine/D-amino acid oxidase-like deaminating enzyme/nitrite reductase/ring-hydroxylating ferredoxin subunit
MPSVWDDAKPPKFHALAENVSADVCIVGAGIAGLSTAYLLLKSGKTVVVLEAKDELGRGETGVSSAHLSNGLDDRYYNLEKSHGEAGMRYAAQSHTAAIARIEQIVADEKIQCDFERVDGYLFAAPKKDPDELQKEIDAVHRAGLISVEWVDRVPFSGFDTGRCLRFPGQAQFHPLKYLFGLAHAVKRLGGRIYTNTKATEFVGGREAFVGTSDGVKVSTEALVVATNVPVNDRVVIHTKQAAYRSYVIGLKIPVGAVEKALYWDTAEPYHYIRTQRIPGDEKHAILIVGGEDHKTGQGQEEDIKHYAHLETWVRHHFPKAGKVEYKWSGQIIEPIDGLAFIGRNPNDEPNVYIATGDSGNGLTHGTIAGLLITDLINGRSNPWETLYNPSRSPLHAFKEFVKENLNVVPQYKDWVTPGEIKSEERIKRNSGKVVRRGLQKIAAYRDEHGAIFECSAMCPHLGCIVNWNGAENTWDCPCHGSRFDPKGKVLNGPANSDLPEVTKTGEKIS